MKLAITTAELRPSRSGDDLGVGPAKRVKLEPDRLCFTDEEIELINLSASSIPRGTLVGYEQIDDCLVVTKVDCTIEASSTVSHPRGG